MTDAFNPKGIKVSTSVFSANVKLDHAESKEMKCNLHLLVLINIEVSKVVLKNPNKAY